MAGRVITQMCDLMGTKKVFTAPFHPQTDGMVERFNKTLCDAVQREMNAEKEWVDLLPLVDFQYNASQHATTKTEPYKAMFGVLPFDFDASFSLEYHLDCRDKRSLAERLGAVHRDMIENDARSKAANAKFYDRSVQETKYAVGDRVYVFNGLAKLQEGRKLRPPWIGPYVVQETLGSVGVVLKGKVTVEKARAHVNRLRRASDVALESLNPQEGMYPDSRRLLRNILKDTGPASKKVYHVKRKGRNGYVKKRADELPEIDVKAYHLAKTGCKARD